MDPSWAWKKHQATVAPPSPQNPGLPAAPGAPQNRGDNLHLGFQQKLVAAVDGNQKSQGQPPFGWS